MRSKGGVGGWGILFVHVQVLVNNQMRPLYEYQLFHLKKQSYSLEGGDIMSILIYGWLFEYRWFFFQEQGYSLEGEGRQRFTKAVDLIHSYMTRKILGTLKKEDVEFMECLGGQDNAQTFHNVLWLKSSDS